MYGKRLVGIRMPDISKVYKEIEQYGRAFSAKKIVLFGSRARGTNTEKSDIDLAVFGCRDFMKLQDALQEELWSLLRIDVINMDGDVSPELAKEIEKDGVVLYEEV